MEIKDLKKPETRKIGISIRTYPSYSEWLKKKEISPSKLFNEAVKELMKKNK